MRLNNAKVKMSSWLTEPNAMLFRAALHANNHKLAKWLTRNPHTFHQRLRHKMLHDRNPQLVTFADKIKAKDFIASRIGADFVVPALQTATQGHEVNVEMLPREFAAKVNHASGGIFLVSDDAHRRHSPLKLTHSLDIIELHPADLEIDYLVKQLDIWLQIDYGDAKGEWAYTQIMPRILIEQLLKFENNRPPADYRFFMFYGHLGMLVRDQQTSSSKISNIYSADLAPLTVRHGSLVRPTPRAQVPAPELPPTVSQMLRLAKELSRDVDFLRVDMFTINNQIFVGELTNYPLAGLGRFSQRKFDSVLGQRWAEAQVLANS